jgi:hypothetical protein
VLAVFEPGEQVEGDVFEGVSPNQASLFGQLFHPTLVPFFSEPIPIVRLLWWQRGGSLLDPVQHIHSVPDVLGCSSSCMSLPEVCNLKAFECRQALHDRGCTLEIQASLMQSLLLCSHALNCLQAKVVLIPSNSFSCISGSVGLSVKMESGRAELGRVSVKIESGRAKLGMEMVILQGNQPT